MNRDVNVVTGVTGYTGKYIALKLLSSGERVKSLTGHPSRENPFNGHIEIFPYNFENKEALAKSLEGATTLYNTYWVRFSHGPVTYDLAVRNTKILLEAAKAAGIRKIVHVSIANPDENSSLPYYRGKAILEKMVMESGMDYAIVRPTVIFGPEDILINNIAWFLRRIPFFTVAGSGDYGIQPIFVEDMAELCISLAHQKGNAIVDAIGPETFRFIDLVRLIREKIHSHVKIIHVSPKVLLAISRLAGQLTGDVVLTPEEIEGLMANVLISSNTPTGKTRFTDWISQNAHILGTKYTSEIKRHFQ